MSFNADTIVPSCKRRRISSDDDNTNNDNFDYVPLVQRKQRINILQQQIIDNGHQNDYNNNNQDDSETHNKDNKNLINFDNDNNDNSNTKQPSLLELSLQLRQNNTHLTNEQYEQLLLNQQIKQHKTPLGQENTDSQQTENHNDNKQADQDNDNNNDIIDTGYRYMSCKTMKLLEQHPMIIQQLYDKYGVIIEGYDIPLICTKFKYMRLPYEILKALRNKHIQQPTPIQMIGLPIVLSGRDMIGIANTGSGKTLVFTVPLILRCIQYEIKYKLQIQQSAIGVILCPSRELAKQIYDIVEYYTDMLYNSNLWPRINALLCIGGIDNKVINDKIRNKSIHIVVATPGRLIDLLNNKRVELSSCQYIAMDEADRMIDLGFESDIRTIYSYIHKTHQTVLFSATMPKRIQNFAISSLNNPILCNVGRANTVNIDVIQEFEYIADDNNRLTTLLDVIQKTSPPVLIFASSQSDVDLIYEYLLTHNIDCVSLHGGKSQSERIEAIDRFKSNKADILISTDVGSKGLDFPHIQHVINYDMPKSIEDYIHRIGRTGRSGNTGISTTYINYDININILKDLKQLLVQSKQLIPPFLINIDNPYGSNIQQVNNNNTSDEGCSYCGGLGHNITTCPKLAAINKQRAQQSRRYDDNSNLG